MPQTFWQQVSAAHRRNDARLRGYVRKRQYGMSVRRRWTPSRSRTGRYWGGRTSGIRPEVKFFDTTLGSTAIVVAGTVHPSIVLIPQGDTESTRDGRKINIRAIHFSGILHLHTTQSENVAGDLIRLCLVQDKQANKATFAVGDVIGGAYNAFFNLDNTDRFRILKTNYIDLNVMAAGGNGTAIETVEYHLPFRFSVKGNWPVQYSAGTGAITEITSNNFSLVSFAAMSNSTVTITYTARVRFTG